MPGLREREAPQARVYAYIRDPIHSSNGSRRFVELLGFRSVNSNISMTSAGTATITFPNYKGALMRYVDRKSIHEASRNNKGAEAIHPRLWSEYLRDIIIPDTSNSFAKLWDDTVLMYGHKPIINKTGTPGDNKLIDWSRSRGDIVSGAKRQVAKQVYNDELMLCVPSINMFDPIFIDYKGQDGFWYAGFTGLVSRVSENYQRTGDQSITINCKDLSILLDNVSLVSGWNMMSVAESNSSLRDFIYSSEGNLASDKHTGYSNIFASFGSVEKIILEVVKRSQDMWTFERNSQPLFTDTVGIRAFKFDTTMAYPYLGFSSRRGSTQMGSDPSLQTAEYFRSTDYALERHHYLAYKDQGLKKILIDPLLMQMDNMFIHKLLNNSLALFKDSLKSADQVLTELAAKMLAYKYFDANGNLVFELAKPNALPNLKEYGGRSTSTIILHATPEKDPNKPKDKAISKENKYYKVLPREGISAIAKKHGITRDTLITLNGGEQNTRVFGRNTKTKALYVYADISIIVGEAPPGETDTTSIKYQRQTNVKPIKTIGTWDGKFQTSDGRTIDPASFARYTTLRFHGKNYILSPDDFQGFTSAIDEAALTTVVATDAVMPFISSLNGQLVQATESLHGVAVADYEMLAKLGVRRFQTQSIYNVQWPDPQSGARVLSYQSAAVLERVNSLADSGSVTLGHRPELQVGRTFVNPLRMKSHIITGISNSWASGGTHSTALTLTYGKPLHKTLEVPWLALFIEPEVFFADGFNAFDKITAIDANGMEKVPTVNESGVGTNYSDGAQTNYIEA